MVGELFGELRGELRGEFRGEFRGELRGELLLVLETVLVLSRLCLGVAPGESSLAAARAPSRSPMIQQKQYKIKAPFRFRLALLAICESMVDPCSDLSNPAISVRGSTLSPIALSTKSMINVVPMQLQPIVTTIPYSCNPSCFGDP